MQLMGERYFAADHQIAEVTWLFTAYFQKISWIFPLSLCLRVLFFLISPDSKNLCRGGPQNSGRNHGSQAHLSDQREW